MDHRVKMSNERIMISVDGIFAAIAEKKKVSFTYYEYAPDKQNVHRHNGQIYVVSPYDMIWNDDYYYFTAFDSKAGIMKIYRADRVDQLTIL